MKKIQMVIAGVLLASAVAGPAQARAVDPADRAAAIIARFDQAGDRMMNLFNRLAARAEARGKTRLAERLRAKGARLNARFDAIGVRIGCRVDPSNAACSTDA